MKGLVKALVILALFFSANAQLNVKVGAGFGIPVAGEYEG